MTADVRSQSAPALGEIATLMKVNSKLAAIVVRQADTLGNREPDPEPSRRRADSLLLRLTANLGADAGRPRVAEAGNGGAGREHRRPSGTDEGPARRSRGAEPRRSVITARTALGALARPLPRLAALLALSVTAPVPAAVAAPAARAAAVPDFIKSNVGEWLIVTDDGKPGCRVRLAAERTIGGYAATPAPDCATRNPRVAGVAAWDYDGGVRLRDATRTLVLDFQEDETTVMKTSWETPPVAYLVKAKPGVDRAPFAPALVGAWSLRRPDGPALCEVVLSKVPPNVRAKDAEDDLVLRTGTPCDASIGRLKLNRWTVEGFALTLFGEPETSLRFEPSGPETYAKAEAGRPLDLVRVR